MYHKIKEIFEDISEIRILHQPLKGICHALNEGIKKANYNYICRQDDDDISLPLRIYETYQYLVENKLDVAFCRADVYTQSKVKRWRKRPIVSDRASIYFFNPYIHATMVTKRETH